MSRPSRSSAGAATACCACREPACRDPGVTAGAGSGGTGGPPFASAAKRGGSAPP
ncbi:MAG: hypothetical protein QM704_06805 [Anaeromyxobacteraceae bacterium]